MTKLFIANYLYKGFNKDTVREFIKVEDTLYYPGTVDNINIKRYKSRHLIPVGKTTQDMITLCYT